MTKKRIQYADDDVSPVSKLLRLRIPSLIIGLFLGLFLSFITSGFEEVLNKNIALAFFLPLIVYLAGAIGTQTETIYTRDLKSGKADFKKYLVKETLLGALLGFVLSVLSSLVIFFWFGSFKLILAVGISLFCAILTAPPIALFVTKIIYFYREDPAVGSGPIATIIQDVVSIVIYGFISSAILL